MLPAGKCIRQIPEGDHAREVERCNRGAHAQRLADHDLIDAGRDILDEFALHHHRHAAGDFHILIGADHLGFGFFEGLAAFIGDELRDLIPVGAQQIPQLEKILHAILDRGSSPGRESFAGSLCRSIDDVFSSTAASLRSPVPLPG